MMGAEVNSILNLSKTARQEGVNSKATSFARRSHRSLKILEKSLIKRQ